MQMMFDFEEVATEDISAIEGKVITENPELDGLTLDDLLNILIKETGLPFIIEKKECIYRNKKAKRELKFDFGNYNYYELPLHQGDHHKERIIHCLYNYSTGGESMGASTIEELITFVNNHKEKMEEN